MYGRKTVKVKTFYIGKLYIREQKNQDFALKDYETWSVAGIQKQWREHRCEEYGMMVIAAIGQESIPEGVQDVTKELYTLALEIQHFNASSLEWSQQHLCTDGNSSGLYGLCYRINYKNKHYVLILTL